MTDAETVRRRPGMYAGGTDAAAVHTLAREIFGNALDEAAAGFADKIEVDLRSGGVLSICDNGRGISVDHDNRFDGLPVLEAILTRMLAGLRLGSGKPGTGRPLGIGMMVVNALSDRMDIEVVRDARGYAIRCERGDVVGGLKETGQAQWRGTRVSFRPDPAIFETGFQPEELYRMASSAPAGVDIVWKCDCTLIDDGTPPEAHFRGLSG